MSETPQQKEENELIPSETAPETGLTAQEEDELVLSPEEAGEEVEEELDPAEVKIFGMPRLCFHGAAFGVAIGYILCGVIGIVLEKTGIAPGKVPSPSVCALVCAGLGYLITKRIYNKRHAAERAEETEQTDSKN